MKLSSVYLEVLNVDGDKGVSDRGLHHTHAQEHANTHALTTSNSCTTCCHHNDNDNDNLPYSEHIHPRWHFAEWCICCHSIESRAPIANPAKSAQLGDIPYRALVKECGEGQTDTHTYRHTDSCGLNTFPLAMPNVKCNDKYHYQCYYRGCYFWFSLNQPIFWSTVPEVMSFKKSAKANFLWLHL